MGLRPPPSVIATVSRALKVGLPMAVPQFRYRHGLIRLASALTTHGRQLPPPGLDQVQHDAFGDGRRLVFAGPAVTRA